MSSGSSPTSSKNSSALDSLLTNAPGRSLTAPGKGALHVAHQLALDELTGDGTAIEGDERPRTRALRCAALQQQALCRCPVSPSMSTVRSLPATFSSTANISRIVTARMTKHSAKARWRSTSPARRVRPAARGERELLPVRTTTVVMNGDAIDPHLADVTCRWSSRRSVSDQPTSLARIARCSRDTARSLTEDVGFGRGPDAAPHREQR